eukprot:scaffold14440_cov143-Isochrysis_galbana.AAC.6
MAGAADRIFVVLIWISGHIGSIVVALWLTLLSDIGPAGISATVEFPWPCRSAQRPKERRARQWSVGVCSMLKNSHTNRKTRTRLILVHADTGFWMYGLDSTYSFSAFRGCARDPLLLALRAALASATHGLSRSPAKARLGHSAGSRRNLGCIVASIPA